MKNMKRTKIIALTLILIMFSSLILSCAEEKPSGEQTNTSAENDSLNTNSPEIQEETSEIASSDSYLGEKPNYDLPVEDFNGYEFRIISRSYNANSHWYNLEFDAEAETGDAINDAVYKRNKTIEEKYNVTIKSIPSDDVGGNVSKAVKAGDDAYDVVVIGLNGGQESLTTQAMLHDLKTLPHVDLTKPWWDALAVKQLSINDKLFATSSDLTIRDKDATIILTFSKQLVKDYGLEDIYQLVLSGKWTFDKMYEMMKAVSRDINGDGTIDDEDVVGLLTQTRHSRAFFNAAGEYTAKVNADGVPEITLYNNRAVEVSDLINEIQGNRTVTLDVENYNSKYSDIWSELQIPMFSENRALFCHAGMNRVTLFRDIEADFGIIPPPKYNEQQENYYVWVDPWCTSAVSVPITVSDPVRTGLLLEALTYESRYTLLPAYYDINLKTKLARDDESKEMIDIILNNRLYDIGDMYGWGSMGNLFNDLAKGTGSLVTFYEKNETRIKIAMQKTIDLLNAIE